MRTLLQCSTCIISSSSSASTTLIPIARRSFHDYFVTHLPSSSAHPDSRGPRPSITHHKLPRSASTPHDPSTSLSQRAASVPPGDISRDHTVVRIPLRSAKHHYGAFSSRGQRPYNEDTFQAGTIELPAFATRRPKSLTVSQARVDTPSAAGAAGDPQVFYFAIFDGHGGNECSDFLKDSLHEYVEDAAKQFGLQSSLRGAQTDSMDEDWEEWEMAYGLQGSTTEKDDVVIHLERSLVRSWRDLVGGYFRRFRPEYFTLKGGGQGKVPKSKKLQGKELIELPPKEQINPSTMEAVIEWSFLKADYEFIAAQVSKEDIHLEEQAINADEILENPNKIKKIGGPKRFIGGSTCSVVMISTPTPTPFWNPGATSTILTAHCGDTRIILCDTNNGDAIPLTSTHHPDDPIEAQRMRRFTASFSTDSFGEARVGGLANTRSFGDMPSKRVGVSAEPEIIRLELDAAQYSFMVLMSDGVSGQLSDQEICDVIKESRTPEQGAKDVVSLATEISSDGDNATAMVIRLGGWERRNEGGGGSLRTKEEREFKRQEAVNPRSRLR